METALIVAGANIVLNGIVVAFWKPWLSAYGGEKAKNLARKEDLTAILAEVRAVTVTQKEIEAQLAGGTWNRQTLWTQKRDAYANVIKTAELVARQFGRISAGIKMAALADEDQAKHISDVNALLAAHPPMMSEFHAATSVAVLFVSHESEKVLDSMITSIETPEGELTADWAIEEGKKISTQIGRLISLAKKDLHLNT